MVDTAGEILNAFHHRFQRRHQFRRHFFEQPSVKRIRTARGNTLAGGFHHAPGMCDQHGSRFHQHVPRLDNGQIGLGLCPAMVNRMQQLWIEPSDSGQHLRIPIITLFVAVPDHPQLAWIPDQNLVAQFFKNTADPPRVRPGLHDHPTSLQFLEVPPDRFGRVRDSRPPQDLPLSIQHANVVILVSHIHPNRDTFAHDRSPFIAPLSAFLI